MRTRRNRAGFTLLEVLVATAIVGTAVAALLSLFSATLGNIQRLEAPERSDRHSVRGPASAVR